LDLCVIPLSPVIRPALLSEYSEAWRAPFGNIHFVRTDTSYEWKGYIEGPLRASEPGAGEVIAALMGPVGRNAEL
jgi:monoamine oxidase